MASKKKIRVPTEHGLDEIGEALEELRVADFSTPSDTESALDSLASVLLKHFFANPKKEFWGRTPSLYDVVKELDRRFSFDSSLVAACSELEDYAVDAYEDEFNEFVIDEIQASADAFCETFESFLLQFRPD